MTLSSKKLHFENESTSGKIYLEDAGPVVLILNRVLGLAPRISGSSGRRGMVEMMEWIGDSAFLVNLNSHTKLTILRFW